MGVFEWEAFRAGTEAVGHARGRVLRATRLWEEGDSVAAIGLLGLADQIDHISTGGGASLELLEGKDPARDRNTHPRGHLRPGNECGVGRLQSPPSMGAFPETAVQTITIAPSLLSCDFARIGGGGRACERSGWPIGTTWT